MINKKERTEAICDALMINDVCKVSALNLQENRDLTMFIGVKDKIFKGIIIVSDDAIGIELYASIFGEENEMLREKIKKANEDPDLMDAGKRWAAFRLTTKPLHILVAALIGAKKDESNKFMTAFYYDAKFSTLIKIIERNWFLFETN